MNAVDAGEIRARASGGDAEAQFQLAGLLDGEGRHEEAVQWLGKAAKAGHVAAMTALGTRMLVGRDAPMAPVEGTQMLLAAARGGGAEAAARLSVLAGAGACTPQSWPTALDCLQRAAELGWEPARAQLVVLAGDRALAAEARNAADLPELWKRLRESVDIAHWTAPPMLRAISETPHICTIDGALAEDACDWIMTSLHGKVRPARVFDRATGASRVERARTNSAFEYDIVQADLVLLLARARIAAASGFATNALENTNVLHYTVGQQFARHFDFLEPNAPGFAREIARMGQRAATFLIYLNDDYEGGETDFPAIELRNKGRKGDGLFFRNTDASGAPDRLTVHAGLPPISGEKWLLSQWIRDRAPAPA